MASTLRLLRLPRNKFPSMLHQLVFEERLFRLTNDNWCVFGHGPREPAVVMGISGKPEKLLNIARCRDAELQVVKRFSGGGTVVVDDSTLFVSWVCHKDLLPHTISNSPPALMQWSADFYADALARCRSPQAAAALPFGLQEHDYCFGTLKFGGNAQCITRERWVHHTSFLWDFDDQNMEFLTLPEKRPDYRADRDHRDFLCRLKDHVEGGAGDADSSVFVDAVVGTAAQSFECVWADFDAAEKQLEAASENATSSQLRLSTRDVQL